MSENSQESNNDRMRLAIQIAVRFLSLFLMVWLVMLLPAGTYDYWQVYVYFGLIVAMAVPAVIYFLIANPEILRQRMEYREQQKTQKIVIFVVGVSALFLYLVPALDKRFGWSQVPDWLCLIAAGLVAFGYLISLYVVKVNDHASRVIKVDSDQVLIDTGPYAVVRHPMYVGALLMFIATPFALASYWALLPVVPILIGIAVRIPNEEQVLRQELQGYEDYMQRVRWRLIPGIW